MQKYIVQYEGEEEQWLVQQMPGGGFAISPEGNETVQSVKAFEEHLQALLALSAVK